MKTTAILLATAARDPIFRDCWDEPAADPILFPRARRRIRRVSGAHLRKDIVEACKSVGGNSAGAEKDIVGFLRWIPEEHVIRAGRDIVTHSEATARLCGAIRAAASSPTIPGWLRRDIAGGGPAPHRRCESRTEELREATLFAWRGLAAVGYCPHRLLRRIDRIRRQAWVRWGIDIPRHAAINAAGYGRRHQLIVALEAVVGTPVGYITSGGFDRLGTLVKLAKLPAKERMLALAEMQCGPGRYVVTDGNPWEYPVIRSFV